MSSSSRHVLLLALLLIKSNARRLAQMPALLPPLPLSISLSLCWAFSLSTLSPSGQGVGAHPSALEAFAIFSWHSFILVHAAGLSRGYLFDGFGRQPTSRPNQTRPRRAGLALSGVSASSTEFWSNHSRRLGFLLGLGH